MPKNNSLVTTLSVIAGSLKGRKLTSPRLATTHPMGAREKNALFNMVDVRGELVLDAYAGSGALGIEALSRGALAVTFVENHRQAVLAIKQNLDNLNLSDADIFAGRVADFVAKSTEVFDVIIADPPYDKIDLGEITELSSLLAPDGVMVLSSPARQPAPEIANLVAVSSHTYAEARITVFIKAKNNP